MKLGVNSYTLQIHGKGPKEIAIASSTMRTNNQSKNESGNNQEKSSVLLRDLDTNSKCILCDKSHSHQKQKHVENPYMMRVVGILHREHDQVDQNHDNNKGKAFHKLIKAISRPRN